MTHFYESSIITTKDGLHCQVYGNEHPFDSVLVKPKYIPTDKIECSSLQYRFLFGRKMNRLNLWSEKENLKKYISSFKQNYPHYIYSSSMHTQKQDRLFFSVPINNIERIYFPRKGLSELMKMPLNSLDEHLKLVYEFVNFLLKSGLRKKDLGVTYSTLIGHYSPKISDINIVIYGKEQFWKVMNFLKTAQHPLLRWKTEQEWLQFHRRRSRYSSFEKEQFIELMSRKKSEGYFGVTLFVLFAAEKEEETWFKWDQEKYTTLGLTTIKAKIKDNFDSVVRPGRYTLTESQPIEEKTIKNDIIINQIVFYSRDYCMLAFPGEEIQARGVLEKVETSDKKVYYRLVIGYFDSYLNERREQEYIKVIK